MADNIASNVSRLIERIEDFSNMKSAANGQLSEDEYFRWVVPISKLWETVYDSAQNHQGTNLSDLIAGRETEHERGISVLTAVLKTWPFPAIAGQITQVCLPQYDQNLLRKVFVGMLPQLKVASGLLAELSKPDVTIQMLRDHAGCSRQPVMKAMEGETLTKERLGRADWYVYAELLPILKAKSNTAQFRWPPSVAGLKKTAKNS